MFVRQKPDGQGMNVAHGGSMSGFSEFNNIIKKELGDRLINKFREELRSFRCQYTIDLDTGDGMPLVDMLTTGTTITDGIKETEHIADELASVALNLILTNHDEKCSFCDGSGKYIACKGTVHAGVADCPDCTPKE